MRATAESSPLVSVIMPCYNAEEYVAEAIESVLRQSYDPIEVVVIDDGSTDGSLDVIRSFDGHVTWRTGENRGVSAARNRGIEIAEGELVKFLDADDVLPEHSVETQVRQIQEIARERVSVFGDGKQIGPEGRVLGHSSFRQMRAEENPIAYILKVNPGTQYSLHHRESLVEVGGFDENLRWAEDFDLHLRLHLAGILLKYCPADIVQVRRHGGNDRLSNLKSKEFSEDPWQPYERGRDRERKIREAHQGRLPDAVAQHLAKGFWGGGRRAVQAGHPEAAEAFFVHAQEVHSQYISSSSFLYRWAVRLFGPIRAEQIMEWERRFRRGARKIRDSI